ncbi:retinoblastoma-like protein 1 isoform X3 [Solenopsis invicta]|uniref:retinoblastoma-like protein 1 isoform X3 n=1 Tax=Solenopsis invicta TaxID=13686 RepID=UPI00193CB87E|nr:retinoblastoma-like protein 1 isoform X3 [Solenopsis invicta]
MGQSDDSEDSMYGRHQDLCQKLNMDAVAASEAWKSYETIRQNYTLEGDQLHWIGCAVYVACRKFSIPTVGRPGTNVEGNCVSLTRLLQLCNLPLIQFFTKSKSWADMANMPQDFRARIEKLEANFSVSMVIFKKYQPIFSDIFKDPREDTSKPSRSRRHKATPCTPSRVFEFCWTLFICIKGAIHDISDDLVNSYHLLLVCCDLIYNNALLANRKDLLNPNFPGLPANFNDDNYTPPQTANCIVNLLCERHDAIAVEAKAIKEYCVRNYINKLFNEKTLRGDQSNFSGMLEAMNFDSNNKAINKSYEQRMLSVGDFDERIFLAKWRRLNLSNISNSDVFSQNDAKHDQFSKHDVLKGQDANENIGSPTQMMNIEDFHEQLQLKREQHAGQYLAPPTPLTGRKYLRSKDMSNITPVTTATQSVIKLQALIAGQSAPSESLLQMLNNCSQDVKSSLEAKVKQIGEQFCSNYNSNADMTNANDGSAFDFGKKRLLMGQTLFYKLLEVILNDEKRKKPNDDITNLLLNEVFIQCLFACCLEIVIYSYKSNDKIFPWILKALNLDAYYFYKVIEIIIRAEDQLSRDVVKHLNHIEEKILESLAWQSDSPLWQTIESLPDGVPSCEEVALPGTLETADLNTSGQPILRRVTLDRERTHDVQQSPISSASERFQSPIAASGVAKKRLFSETRVTGQSVLRVGQISKSSGTTQTLNNPTQATNRDATKPKRTGSVALFFRKFYNLACVRMQDLCNSLEISDNDKKKIWTIFEYSIKERKLMKDRHLDQILMCAIYVICKLVRMERNSFTEIMRCYRLQPQAESHIYRSVLIKKVSNDEDPGTSGNERSEDNNMLGENITPPTPTNMTGTSQNFNGEIRDDLIKFYNKVYVPQVKEFANKFGSTRGSVMNLSLSPLPKGKAPANSPVRRVTSSIMTRTLDPKAISASPAPQLTYCFSRSPAKDLEAINKMMISVDAKKSVGKRLLSDDTDVEMTEGTSKKTATFVARKLENIIGERRTQNQ